VLLAAALVVPAGAQSTSANSISGFRDAARQRALERQFLAVPDRKLAEQHLRVLTAEPHVAGSPEDRATADYVAQKFRDAGLQTEIRPYRVWLDTPLEIRVELTAPAGARLRAPAPEHVDGDPYQDDSRILPAFNSYSASGDVEAEVVYANYGRAEDFATLRDEGISLRGKIALIRYGQSFRGVKVRLAEQNGLAGVLLFSDPGEDGYLRGDQYPKGPWRPATAVQRGSVEYGLEFPGDPTTPNFASITANESRRVPAEQSRDLPHIPVVPLSAADAQPVLEAMSGPAAPHAWQGGLPTTYRYSGGRARVHMRVRQEAKLTTIWNVIGRIDGAQWPEQLVIAGNHRDAWVYGAVDPSSGTAAMLEAVHGLGELLKSGWRPKRTIIFASWDAEEQGLIGSTEWVEENERQLASAVAYFNLDSGASGPFFRACASGELKTFMRDVARAIPSPGGGTVFDHWRDTDEDSPFSTSPGVGNLGGGSDYAAFIHHAGVPSSDIRSLGDYGVYHSAFDNFAWYTRFGDPGFAYTQQMARFFGLEALRMAEADVLPYDFAQYGREIAGYVDRTGSSRANSISHVRNIDAGPALLAAHRLAIAGASAASRNWQAQPAEDDAALNDALVAASRALLLADGLPGRSWFRHAVYAPARDNGYGVTPLPGITDASAGGDRDLALRQAALLATALQHAAQQLEGAATISVARAKAPRRGPAAILPTLTTRQKSGGR
jgi:N-acetylated-alpha-linked acidic dipeptidase